MRELCKCCGKELRPMTALVQIKQSRSEHDRESRLWSYYYFGDKASPKTIDDCRKLTNLQVLSVKKWRGDIKSFSTWDGERYHVYGKYFCSVSCAVSFARSAIERSSFVGHGYLEAQKKRRESC